MPIEIRCENISGFDAAVGTYQKCGQKLRVPEKYAGKSVKCPKCSQPISIPAVTASSIETQKEADPGVPSASPSALGAAPDVMNVEFNSRASVSSAAHDSVVARCPKCGGTYNQHGICTLCNYAEPVQKARRDRQQKKSVRPAGFQLWLMQMSNDPKNVALVGYSFFAAFNFLGLLAMVVGILSVNLIGALVAVVAAFVLFFLWVAFFKTRQLARDPEASLGVFSIFWDLTLSFARKGNWQNYDSRFKGRCIIDLRSQQVSDETWPAVSGFKEAQVIDLENCNITDAGLRHLYGHHHLHCLVVKGTQVTQSGIANLQQALPRIWIWH